MKKLALTLVVLAVLVGGGSYALGVFDEDAGDTVRERVSNRLKKLTGDDGVLDRDLAGSSCEKLAATTDAIAAEVDTPETLIRRLGLETAGIHSGARALVDLARGGTNRIPGAGFKNPYNDQTAGQARHFSGIAVAASYGGEEATRLISIFARQDPLDSPDGRLTERGIDFAKGLLNGEIPQEDAGEWILENLCRPSDLAAESAEAGEPE